MDVLIEHLIVLIINQYERVFFVLLKEVLKEFTFDCEIRKISPRTLKGYTNNNLRFLNFIEKEFNIIELEEIRKKKDFSRRIPFLFDELTEIIGEMNGGFYLTITAFTAKGKTWLGLKQAQKRGIIVTEVFTLEH